MSSISVMMTQLIQSAFLILIAPLLIGWNRQNHAWLSQKSKPSILQPYRHLHKLFLKEPVLAENASSLFRIVPYLYFSAMCVATAIIPVLSSTLPFTAIADVIALVGLFALARIFLTFGAMDVGTAFGMMGARREMFIAFLSEPALLMVFFNIALMSQSTALSTIVHVILSHPLTINPSLAFAAVAFIMILLAENTRMPIDNPATHLELTMIHQAMILEYSGRYLALIEWGNDLKLLNYFAIGVAVFFPWGIPNVPSFQGVVFAVMFFLIKIFILGSGLALLEVMTSKVRLFRVPEFLTSAFLLAILGVLTQLLTMR